MGETFTYAQTCTKMIETEARYKEDGDRMCPEPAPTARPYVAGAANDVGSMPCPLAGHAGHTISQCRTMREWNEATLAGRTPRARRKRGAGGTAPGDAAPGVRGACWNCGQVGHQKRDCPNAKVEGAGGARMPPAAAAAAPPSHAPPNYAYWANAAATA